LKIIFYDPSADGLVHQIAYLEKLISEEPPTKTDGVLLIIQN
jgi:hypothetical protein